MEQNELIASRILADMSDGVMALDSDGSIITFNQAAERILGFSAQALRGKSLSEVFLSLQSNDAFNQAILDAVYNAAVGDRKIVDFANQGRKLTLALTTSLFHAESDGSGPVAGVIVVFSDMTEVRSLQEAESRMAQEIKAKHRELQEAFRQTEASNSRLAAALKKIQTVRNLTAVFVVVLGLALGLFYWRQGLFKGSFSRGAPPERSVQEAAVGTELEVQVRPVTSSISLTGRLAPLQTVNVNSPVNGRIEDMRVQYGDLVQAGQVLMVMDTLETQVKHREARAQLIRAEEALREVVNWESGTDVSRAKRLLIKARLAMDAQKKSLEENERLFSLGIIPRNEIDVVRQQHTTQLLDLQSAEEELKAARARGSADNLVLARIEQENALVRLKQIDAEMGSSVIRAPVAGIVIKPALSGAVKGNVAKQAARGENFTQGEIILAIGDLTGFTVQSKVDEIDVTKLKPGQRVRISGDAFQGIDLSGTIRGVAPQADEADARALPSFVITVAVEDLNAEQRRRILVGMSANLEVMVYENPAAIMLPLSAVMTEGSKRFVLQKVAGAGSPQRVEVTTGYTTIDSVEVVRGLKPGDRILTDDFTATGAPAGAGR